MFGSGYFSITKFSDALRSNIITICVTTYEEVGVSNWPPRLVKKGKGGPIAYWPLGRRTVRFTVSRAQHMEGGAHPSPSAAFPSLN